MNNIDIEHLRSAIVVAWQAREHGNHPFEAVLVDEDNHFLLQAENTILTARDSTGHAETNLVRLATQRFSQDQLNRHTLYQARNRAPCAPERSTGVKLDGCFTPSARLTCMILSDHRPSI